MAAYGIQPLFTHTLQLKTAMRGYVGQLMYHFKKGEPMIKCVVFDFDGTIVESRYLAIDILNQLAKKYGFRQIEEKEFEKLRSLSLLERCKYINIPVFMIPIVYVELKNKYQQATNELQLYKGISKVIRALKEKEYKLSIISSNSIDIITELLKKNDINSFDSIYSSKNYFGKDWAISAYLRKYSLNNKDVVYIGDEYRDIIASKRNNVKVIAVTWGYDSLELLKTGKPDFIAASPGELLNIIHNKLA